MKGKHMMISIDRNKHLFKKKKNAPMEEDLSKQGIKEIS